MSLLFKLSQIGFLDSFFTLLGNRGFSIGIGDVTPGKGLVDEKEYLVEEGYGGWVVLISY